MITAKTDVYCIFGNPVRHSLSPLIHNSAFEELGINAVYVAFEPDSIEQGVRSMRELGIKGASITIPFKVDVIPFLDSIDPLAERIGSVNTLLNLDGKIIGYNTDGLGATLALKNNHIEIENQTYLVIGNGGSARAIAFTLLQNNAKIVIAGRNQQRIANLKNDLAKHGTVDHILLDELEENYMENVDVIINTTPVGMHPEAEKSPIKNSLIVEKHAVFDIVYSPDITILLKTANEKGCIIVRGFEMLLYQGVKQFEIWTGKEAPVQTMYNVLDKAINK